MIRTHTLPLSFMASPFHLPANRGSCWPIWPNAWACARGLQRPGEHQANGRETDSQDTLTAKGEVEEYFGTSVSP